MIPDSKLRNHQLRAVEAMKSVDAACQKHGIKYFLIAGSALGAVRHRGFIPWDDDIDLGMTLDQFGKFLAIAPSAIRPPYVWRHTSVDETFPTLTGRILLGDDEALITVFPLVKLSDNPLVRKLQWAVRKTVSAVWQRKIGHRFRRPKKGFKGTPTVVLATLLSAFFTKRTLLSFLRRNERLCEGRRVRRYCNIYSKYSMEKESIRADWLEESVRLPFEDAAFPVMKEYDAYLTHLYGDYMTPPPEHQRRPVHL
jgi:lipopolysaccharide cholinephosphotransferase